MVIALMDFLICGYCRENSNVQINEFIALTYVGVCEDVVHGGVGRVAIGVALVWQDVQLVWILLHCDDSINVHLFVD